MTVTHLGSGQIKTWKLVGVDGKPGEGTLSIDSAVGRAVQGRVPGDEAKVSSPGTGVVVYRVERVLKTRS